MIAKITSGGGFGGTERYIEDYNGRDNKIVEELDHKGVDIRIGHDGQLQVNPTQVALSFREQADLNPNVSKPVGHTCLSFHPKDAPKLTNEKMLEIAHKYMDRMGIKDTQYHIVRHNEKNNPHCHIVWNRVDENGNRYNDSNERKRSAQVCKQLTKEYGLTLGEHKSISKSDVNEQSERTRYDLCRDIYQSLARTRSLDGLQRDLQRLGIETQIKRDSNGNPQGISFSRDGQAFKGSEVDRKLSCGNIQKFYRACSQHLGQGRTVQMQVTSQMRQSQTGKGEIVARKVCGVVGIILEGCLTNTPPKEMNHKLRYFDINPFRPKRSIYD